MHVQSKPTLTKAGLAVGALGAAAVVLFNEVEVVLEVLGVAAAGNFLAKKLLFAKDREQTVEQIRSTLTPMPHLLVTLLSLSAVIYPLHTLAACRHSSQFPTHPCRICLLLY